MTDFPGSGHDDQGDQIRPVDQGDQAEHAALGHSAIVAAVDRLGGLAALPPVEHVEVYEDVHAVLQDALAAAARPAPQGRGPGGAAPAGSGGHDL